ncbi:MAG: hypothetical protein JO293_01780, partial [Candidatus Eremiobacteraeota bacterium]|nr:hypothetical protein [Candidatus Eremiobacteraeota bacterium]
SPEVQVALNTAAGAILLKTKDGDPVPYLRAALAMSPGAGLALEVLDKVYLERKDELSRARMRRDELNAPLVAPVDFLRRSSRLLEEEKPDEAAQVAREGVLREPGNAQLMFNLALALSRVEGNVGQAIDVLDCMRSGEADVVELAALLRAALLEREGRVEEGLAAIERAFGTQPENEDALLHRARLLQKLGHDADAEAGLRAAMRRGSKRVGVELAGMMMRAGRYEDARSIADEALATA